MRSFLLVAGATLCLAAPAMAQSSDEAVAETLACQAVRGTKARLRCFEAALPALANTNPGAVALAKERAQAAQLAAAETARQEFGLTVQQAEKAAEYERDAFGEEDLAATSAAREDDEVKSVEGRAIEIGKNNRGKIFVVLDNGQVWRQIVGDSSSPYYPKDADALPVVIKKGALGSYFVKIGKSKDAFKAERIK